MEKIINIPKIDNFIVRAVRETLEHRGTWLYLLLKEMDRSGTKWETIGCRAIGKCGALHGKRLKGPVMSPGFKYLKKKLFTLPARIVYEIKIVTNKDNRLDLDFGYCPLVSAWTKLGCSNEDIKRLCKISMEGDRAIAKEFGGHLELGDTIANGFNRCQISFIKES